MNACLTRSALTVVLATLAFSLGCDPKLTSLDELGADPGSTGNETSAAVTPEALIVGNILAFHTDVFRAALSVSATFDSASVALRSIATGCATLEALPAGSAATYSLMFDGCTDANGTRYQGGGELRVVNNQDGYTFYPLFDENLLRAINDQDDNYNYTVLSPASTAGAFEFRFVRGQGGEVTAVRVDKFLRHGVRGETVTISYMDLVYTGAIGSHPERPDAGSMARVVWDGVGLFDVEYHGSTAGYTMQGQDYVVDLASGEVSVGRR